MTESLASKRSLNGPFKTADYTTPNVLPNIGSLTCSRVHYHEAKSVVTQSTSCFIQLTYQTYLFDLAAVRSGNHSVLYLRALEEMSIDTGHRTVTRTAINFASE